MSGIDQTYYKQLTRCPIVELSGYTARHHLNGHLYACLLFDGPTGTGKDALATAMIRLATQRGELKKGQPIVETGAGAFAAALAIAAQRSSHPLTLVTPPGLPSERERFLQDLGAKLHPCYERPHGQPGMDILARRLAEEQNAYYMNYLASEDNPEYHRRITGPAIFKSTDNGDLIDAIVAGVGSGGTITGVGEFIKAWTNHIRMVAVEPYECQAIGGGFLGPHGITNIGFGFVPENYNPYVVDFVLAVSTGEAVQAAQDVLLTDGIPAGISAGATLYAARQMLEKGKSKSSLCIFQSRQIYM